MTIAVPIFLSLVYVAARDPASQSNLILRDDTVLANATPDPNDDLGPITLVVSWLLTGLALVALLLRLYAKNVQGKRLWWDDWLLVGAWVMSLLEIAFITECVRMGFGKHFIYTKPQYWTSMSLYGLLSSVFGLTGAAWSKTSFAVTLLRLMKGRIRFAVWFIIITINLLLGFQALFSIAKCVPVQASWDHSIQDAKCLDQAALLNFSVFASIWSGVMDIILAFLPWKIILSLQMVRREKIGVGLAMSMGIFAGATAFVKTSFYFSTTASDWTWTVPQLSMWGTAENTTTIIAASIPMLRVLLRRVIRSHSQGRSHAGPNSHYYGSSSGRGGGGSTTRKGRTGQGVHHSVLVTAQRPACGADDESGRSILRNAASPELGKITRKDEVRIEFSDKTDNDGSVGGYELDTM